MGSSCLFESRVSSIQRCFLSVDTRLNRPCYEKSACVTGGGTTIPRTCRLAVVPVENEQSSFQLTLDVPFYLRNWGQRQLFTRFFRLHASWSGSPGLLFLWISRRTGFNSGARLNWSSDERSYPCHQRREARFHVPVAASSHWLKKDSPCFSCFYTYSVLEGIVTIPDSYKWFIGLHVSWVQAALIQPVGWVGGTATQRRKESRTAAMREISGFSHCQQKFIFHEMCTTIKFPMCEIIFIVFNNLFENKHLC